MRSPTWTRQNLAFVAFVATLVALSCARKVSVDVTAPWPQRSLDFIVEVGEFVHEFGASSDVNQGGGVWDFHEKLCGHSALVDSASTNLTSAASLRPIAFELALSQLPATYHSLFRVNLDIGTHLPAVQFYSSLSESISSLCGASHPFITNSDQSRVVCSAASESLEALWASNADRHDVDVEDWEWVYPRSTTSSTMQGHVQVYGIPGSSATCALIAQVQNAVDSGILKSFVFRPAMQSLPVLDDLTYLAGFGVYLDVKNMEYKNLDDQDASKASSTSAPANGEKDEENEEVMGVNFGQLQQHVESTEALETLRARLTSLAASSAASASSSGASSEELKVWQLQSLGLQMVQAAWSRFTATNSAAEAVHMLRDYVHNFPRHAGKLSHLPVSPEVREAVQQQQQLSLHYPGLVQSVLQPGTLFVNGIRVDASAPSFNAFEMLNTLAREGLRYQRLQQAGISLLQQSPALLHSVYTSFFTTPARFDVDSETAHPDFDVDELDTEPTPDSDSSSGNALSRIPALQGQTLPKRVQVSKGGRFVVQFANNLESDAVYTQQMQWPRPLSALLYPSWSLITLARNVYTMVVVADVLTVEGATLWRESYHRMVRQMYPIRLGLVLGNCQSSAEGLSSDVCALFSLLRNASSTSPAPFEFLLAVSEHTLLRHQLTQLVEQGDATDADMKSHTIDRTLLLEIAVDPQTHLQAVQGDEDEMDDGSGSMLGSLFGGDSAKKKKKSKHQQQKEDALKARYAQVLSALDANANNDNHNDVAAEVVHVCSFSKNVTAYLHQRQLPVNSYSLNGAVVVPHTPAECQLAQSQAFMHLLGREQYLLQQLVQHRVLIDKPRISVFAELMRIYEAVPRYHVLLDDQAAQSAVYWDVMSLAAKHPATSPAKVENSEEKVEISEIERVFMPIEQGGSALVFSSLPMSAFTASGNAAVPAADEVWALLPCYAANDHHDDKLVNHVNMLLNFLVRSEERRDRQHRGVNLRVMCIDNDHNNQMHVEVQSDGGSSVHHASSSVMHRLQRGFTQFSSPVSSADKKDGRVCGKECVRSVMDAIANKDHDGSDVFAPEVEQRMRVDARRIASLLPDSAVEAQLPSTTPLVFYNGRLLPVQDYAYTISTSTNSNNNNDDGDNEGSEDDNMGQLESDLFLLQSLETQTLQTSQKLGSLRALLTHLDHRAVHPESGVVSGFFSRSWLRVALVVAHAQISPDSGPRVSDVTQILGQVLRQDSDDDDDDTMSSSSSLLPMQPLYYELHPNTGTTSSTSSDTPSLRSLLQLQLVLDPLSLASVRLLSLVDLLSQNLGLSVSLVLVPRSDLTDMPLAHFYRFATSRHTEINNDTNNPESGMFGVFFDELPEAQILTTRLDVAEGWNVQSYKAQVDPDNLRCLGSGSGSGKRRVPCGDPNPQPLGRGHVAQHRAGVEDEDDDDEALVDPDLSQLQYTLRSLLVAGQCLQSASPADAAAQRFGLPPNGLQLTLTQTSQTTQTQNSQNSQNLGKVMELDTQRLGVWDTVVMQNLGYYQLQVPKPGRFAVSLAQRAARRAFAIHRASFNVHVNGDDGSDEDVEEYDVQVRSFRDSMHRLVVLQRSAQAVSEYNNNNNNNNVDYNKDVVKDGSKDEKSTLTKVWSSLFSSSSASTPKSTESGSTTQTSQISDRPRRRAEDYASDPHAMHVFSVATGALYERFLRIMMLSVTQNLDPQTNGGTYPDSVHFWLLENYLSPQFKTLAQHLSQVYGFHVHYVTYKWPSWLRTQTAQQRIIWGYKILFLDVLFPLDVTRIVYVDADQVLRADLTELAHRTSLGGAVYGYVPFCASNPDTLGFQFWRAGYWKDHLQGRPYHISALYLVDLQQFRARKTGDLLRSLYDNLARDPQSLSNLDQDLPNYAQDMVPIHSLPQEWLWCETWCSQESKQYAKTIDLCNNPLHKENKLDMAKRIVDGESGLFARSWVQLDEEIRKVAAEVGLVH